MRGIVALILTTFIAFVLSGCNTENDTSVVSTSSESIRHDAELVDGEIALSQATDAEEFGNMLNEFQGEWQEDGKYEHRLVINEETINFIHEYKITINGKSYCNVNTLYFGFDKDGALIAAYENKRPKYNISLDENGILSIKDINSKEDVGLYKKISDNTEVPDEKVDPAIGMTENEVYGSTWGAPKKHNKITTAYGEREQWVYDYGYIYFENGVVTAIQE